jgi:hypothetical protein
MICSFRFTFCVCCHEHNFFVTTSTVDRKLFDRYGVLPYRKFREANFDAQFWSGDEAFC